MGCQGGLPGITSGMIWGESRGIPGAEAMPGSAAPRQLPPRHPQATTRRQSRIWDLMGGRSWGSGGHSPRPGSQRGRPEGFKLFLHDLCLR